MTIFAIGMAPLAGPTNQRAARTCSPRASGSVTRLENVPKYVPSSLYSRSSSLAFLARRGRRVARPVRVRPNIPAEAPPCTEILLRNDGRYTACSDDRDETPRDPGSSAPGLVSGRPCCTRVSRPAGVALAPDAALGSVTGSMITPSVSSQEGGCLWMPKNRAGLVSHARPGESLARSDNRAVWDTSRRLAELGKKRTH